MNHPFTLRASLLVVSLSLALPGCDSEPPQMLGASGTPEMREALFDSIMAMTARRTAFSAPKQEALGFDPLEEMERLRGDVVGAETEDELFYALLRLSNARRDRHLSVGLVDSGLRPTFTDGLGVWDGPEVQDAQEAPVRFRPDFGNGGFFVSDVAVPAGTGVSAGGGGEPEFEGVSIGDRVVSLNGIQSENLQDQLVPYFRYSSLPGLRWKIAEALSLKTALLPRTFVGEELDLVVEKADGNRTTTVLPYFEAESLEWAGTTEPAYPGFEMEWSNPTYDLYLPTGGQRILILQWHRFESSSLLQDVDRLVAFGEENGLLDHAIIFDATRSGGGSLGAYAVQRIQPKPFKTTFGTLRLSDVIEPFVQDKREDFEAERIYDGGGPETVDDGAWLMDWAENDLIEALENGDSVTVPVPFKLAHAPKDSDGVLQPAPVHFRGPLVVFLGPNGGSHLDQFICIVADNDLGHIMGMPSGGYSNTWEWEETLFFPGTYQPVVGFMWNIGHTIRPNGEVLEGNPAPLDESIPLTAGNATRYYDILLERAGEYLRSIGFTANPS